MSTPEQEWDIQNTPVEEQVAKLAKEDRSNRYVVVYVSPHTTKTDRMGYTLYDQKNNAIQWDFLKSELAEAETSALHQNRAAGLWANIETGTPAPAPKIIKTQSFDFPMEGKKVGDIITDHDARYRVTHDSYYLSSQESYDLEDGWDKFIDPGWHTEVVQIIEDEQNV